MLTAESTRVEGEAEGFASSASFFKNSEREVKIASRSNIKDAPSEDSYTCTSVHVELDYWTRLDAASATRANREFSIWWARSPLGLSTL